MNHQAWLFSGQGSQKTGMGLDLQDHQYDIYERIKQADEILGIPLSGICQNGPEEDLTRTEIAQPAIFTYQAVVVDYMKKNFDMPLISAGHSLGEFSAFYAAEVFDFETGLKIVRKRGELMSSADPKEVGGMAAVLGLSGEKVKEICESLSSGSYIEAVNFNSPVQTVISGEKEGIEKSISAFKEAGAKRVVPLKVSGAFHSKMMTKAADEFGSFISALDFHHPKCKVISNVTAQEISAENIKSLMVQQMKSPVLWTDIIKAVQQSGIQNMLEISYQPVLAGMIKKIDSQLKVIQWKDYVSESE